MNEYKLITIDYPLFCRENSIERYVRVIDKDCYKKNRVFLGGELEVILETHLIENLDLSLGSAELKFYVGDYEVRIAVKKYRNVYVLDPSYSIRRKIEFLSPIKFLPISEKELYEDMKTLVLEEDERKAREVINIISRLIPDERLEKIIKRVF